MVLRNLYYLRYNLKRKTRPLIRTVVIKKYVKPVRYNNSYNFRVVNTLVPFVIFFYSTASTLQKNIFYSSLIFNTCPMQSSIFYIRP